MMLVGAVVSFAVTLSTGSIALGLCAGVLSGIALASVFAFVTLVLFANQVAAGLAITIFGIGVSAHVGKSFSGVALPPVPALPAGLLGSIPIIGSLHPLVIGCWIACACVAFFLYHTRGGLIVLAVGESPVNAQAIGYPVRWIRYLCIVFGGALAGLAGAYLAVVHAKLWIEGMTAGRGWIAVALVVFASWRPGRVLVGAYLFGAVSIAQLFAQGAGFSLPSEAMSALPYLATVVVLVLISRNPNVVRMNQPASLGKVFYPSS
jgi:simple sugar transport system permease protein